jgi:hypothetical protein
MAPVEEPWFVFLFVVFYHIKEVSLIIVNFIGGMVKVEIVLIKGVWVGLGVLNLWRREALGELLTEVFAGCCVEGMGLAEIASHSVHVVSLSQGQVHHSTRKVQSVFILTFP